MTLDFLVTPTYNTTTIGIADNSVYDNEPPTVTSPTLEVSIPGFNVASIVFVVQDFNVLNSTILGITEAGESPLPDGIYVFRYSVAPANENFVEKTIMRVDVLQEKFDEAFMKLDMMQCDQSIKRQEKTELNTIYYFIQGAIASANNCATDQANQLYIKADKLLYNFNNKSVCCGN
jgi:hypothetical protein